MDKVVIIARVSTDKQEYQETKVDAINCVGLTPYLDTKSVKILHI